jgi:hypothetical protein
MIIILATNKEFLEKKHSGKIPTVPWEAEGQGGYAVRRYELEGSILRFNCIQTRAENTPATCRLFFVIRAHL